MVVISRNVLVCSLLSILGGLVSGYLLVGFCSSAYTVWRCYYGLSDDTPENQWSIGFLFSVINFGGLPYGFVAGYVMNALGRQASVVVGSSVLLAGSVCSGLSSTLTRQAASRILTGIGTGMVMSAIPVYVQEMSPVNRRGTLQAMFQVSYTLMILLGTFVSYYVLGPNRALPPPAYCPRFTPDDLYVMNGLTMLPGAVLSALLLLVGATAMIESGTWTRRTNSFRRQPMLLSDQSTSHFPRVSFNEIDFGKFISQKTSLLLIVDDEDEDEDEAVAAIPSSFTGLLYVPKSVALGLVCALALQGTGISAVMFYAPRFLAQAGVKRADLGNMAIMLTNFLTAVLAMTLVDRLGRRVLLLPSMAVMTVSLLAMPVVFQAIEAGQLPTWMCFVLLFGYIAGFELGPGTLFGVILNEIFPETVLPFGSSIIGNLSGVLALVTTSVFPAMELAFGSSVFYLFGVVCAGVLVYLYLCQPETKGLTKREIAARLVDSPTWMLGVKPHDE